MLYLTKITYGRNRTEAEMTQLKSYTDDPAVASAYMQIGHTLIVGDPTPLDDYYDNVISAWSNEAAADGYLALINSFVPAPQSTQKLS